MAWNPDVYEKFKKERYLPFYDLLSLVQVKENLKAIDLGCGTGELTAKLAKELPGSKVLGVDSSAEMLQKARVYEDNNLHFQQRDIEQALSDVEKYDLIFSNAALQWLNEHEIVFPKVINLFEKRRAGGNTDSFQSRSFYTQTDKKSCFRIPI